MKKTTPKIPIKLPTNSIVPLNSISAGAHNNTIKAPTTIIGIPTPIEISLEAMIRHHFKNVYEVCDGFKIEFSI